MRDIIPRGLNDKIKELKDKHDEAIEDMTLRIEAIQLESERTMQEKDAAIALLNDDLDAELHKVQDVGKQLVDLEHEPSTSK